MALDKPVTVIEDGEARFEITRDSLEDVVVWNPGPEKAAGMSDFGPKDGWKKMRMLYPCASILHYRAVANWHVSCSMRRSRLGGGMADFGSRGYI